MMRFCKIMHWKATPFESFLQFDKYRGISAPWNYHQFLNMLQLRTIQRIVESRRISFYNNICTNFVTMTKFAAWILSGIIIITGISIIFNLKISNVIRQRSALHGPFGIKWYKGMNENNHVRSLVSSLNNSPWKLSWKNLIQRAK